jgi:BON domain
MRSKAAFLAGVGAAYFLDPDAGKRRRHMLRDRSLRTLRRLERAAVKKLKLLGGHAHGLVATARRAVVTPDVPVDDETVAQRVRSDALRDAQVRAKDVDVRVENGVVTLRGSVPTIDRVDELVSRVKKVPGVTDVSAELRVAGQ